MSKQIRIATQIVDVTSRLRAMNAGGIDFMLNSHLHEATAYEYELTNYYNEISNWDAMWNTNKATEDND